MIYLRLRYLIQLFILIIVIPILMAYVLANFIA